MTKAEGSLVSFRTTFVFDGDGAVLTSDSTLRFRTRGELADSLAAAGFVVDEVRDAPDRPGLSSSSSPGRRHSDRPSGRRVRLRPL